VEALRKVEGVVAVLDRADVDTDQIIPKQFLKRIERTGYGAFLFNDWRFLPDGSLNEDFPLNRTEFEGARILVAGRNFGCGLGGSPSCVRSGCLQSVGIGSECPARPPRCMARGAAGRHLLRAA